VLKEIVSEKQWKKVKKETQNGKLAVIDCYPEEGPSDLGLSSY
jgi:hypothetical protein